MANLASKARGWKNKLRLLVDDTYPPACRLLSPWNLRAEYWIEGAGSEYGRDTNESGVYLYLSTDQVRFYPLGAAQLRAHAGGGGYGPGWHEAADEPLPLHMIPPLVFSSASNGSTTMRSSSGRSARFTSFLAMMVSRYWLCDS